MDFLKRAGKGFLSLLCTAGKCARFTFTAGKNFFRDVFQSIRNAFTPAPPLPLIMPGAILPPAAPPIIIGATRDIPAAFGILRGKTITLSQTRRIP